jgi:hypothetical protein
MEENKAETKTESKPDHKAKLALHRKLVFSYAVIGAVIGYASFAINVPLYALGLMIVVGAIATYALSGLMKPANIGGKRWWSSGLTVYVLMWFVVWTILFNMYIVKP